jgi:NADH-quinone oxidoreductase subunit J
MITIFYISALVAVVATLMVVSRAHAVHALLYLIVSLLAVAVVFYCLGAPFITALEVIIYAGAIMVLFVFVIMMLNVGPDTAQQERDWLAPRTWIGPSLLAGVLLAEMICVAVAAPSPVALAGPQAAQAAIEPAEVGKSLFGPYLIAVELSSMLLLAGLVGACHLGRRLPSPPSGAALPGPQTDPAPAGGEEDAG